MGDVVEPKQQLNAEQILIETTIEVRTNY